jgi:hypothetical protein
MDPRMRTVASQMGQTRSPPQAGSGPQGKGGYMGFVLPMYAVGITLYLVFTLFKIFINGGGGFQPKADRH